MVDHGHVKISRKAYESDPLWLEPREFSRWEAWEDLIQRTAWKRHKRMVGASIVTIERGQVLASERFLAEAWNWSKSRVRRFLTAIEEEGRINREADHQADHYGAIITLCKYDTYQSTPEPNRTTNRTSERTSSEPVANQYGTSSEPVADQREVRESNRSKGSKKEVVDGAIGESEPGPANATTDAATELDELVETAAANPPDDVTPARVRGELSMIVSGDDVTAWHDAHSEQVPWPDRPRLLRLALKQWWLDRDQYPKIRSALRYVISQQYHPYDLPSGQPAMSNDEEQKHYGAHRQEAQQRQKQAELEQIQEKEQAQQEQGQVNEWVARHEDEAQAILDATNEDVKAEHGAGPATSTMVRIEFKRRVLERLNGKGAAP